MIPKQVYRKRKEDRLFKNGYSKRKYFHFDTPVHFQEYLELSKLFENKKYMSQYQFQPLLSFTLKNRKVSKVGKIKERNIMYLGHRDSAIYTQMAIKLEYLYENLISRTLMDKSVSAYRYVESPDGKGMSNIHYAKRLFDFIKDQESCKVHIIDISKFFDSLSHEYLQLKIKEVLGVSRLSDIDFKLIKYLLDAPNIDADAIKSALKIDKWTDLKRSRILNRYDLLGLLKSQKINLNRNNSKTGIPQGTPISGLLANIYMLDFDKFVAERVGEVGGFYQRYSDDIAVVLPANDNGVIKDIYFKLSKIELTSNIDKNKVLTLKKDDTGNIYCTNKADRKSVVSYLGFDFDGQNITLRSSTISRYKRKLEKSTKAHRYWAQVKGEGVFYNQIRRDFGLVSDYDSYGSGNLLTYARRAARIMHSGSLNKQINRLQTKLNQRTKIN